jgi:hypothetical protein
MGDTALLPGIYLYLLSNVTDQSSVYSLCSQHSLADIYGHHQVVAKFTFKKVYKLVVSQTFCFVDRPSQYISTVKPT